MTFRTCHRLVLAALLVLAPAVSIQAADIFTFAGYTFDQRYSPTSGSLLGNGVELGGAQFSTNLPNTVTSSLNFPQGDPGFDSTRALGPLCGLATGTRAVNLPRGNNSGTATNRHGIQVSWNNGRVLANLPGEDFVVFESGSSATGVEGVMARVRTNAAPEGWTDWFYYAPDSYQVATAPEVVFAFGFDLSDLGVEENGTVDRIQIANLTVDDRIDTLTPLDLGGVLVGQGRVVFDTNASDVLPDAGEFDTDRRYGSGTFDPDPLYIAALNPVCESVAPYLSVEFAGDDLLLSWPAPSCFTLESCDSLSDSWTPAAEIQSIVNGRNEVLVTNGAPARFFRLVK